MDNYRIIDTEQYYRRGVFHHFTEDCMCSTSMTARVDVTELARRSKEAGTAAREKHAVLKDPSLRSG